MRHALVAVLVIFGVLMTSFAMRGKSVSVVEAAGVGRENKESEVEVYYAGSYQSDSPALESKAQELYGTAITVQSDTPEVIALKKLSDMKVEEAQEVVPEDWFDPSEATGEIKEEAEGVMPEEPEDWFDPSEAASEGIEEETQEVMPEEPEDWFDPSEAASEAKEEVIVPIEELVVEELAKKEEVFSTKEAAPKEEPKNQTGVLATLTKWWNSLCFTFWEMNREPCEYNSVYDRVPNGEEFENIEILHEDTVEKILYFDNFYYASYWGKLQIENLTHYCPCATCCPTAPRYNGGAWDEITHSGHQYRTGDHILAVNWQYFTWLTGVEVEFGQLVYLEVNGVGMICSIEDTGVQGLWMDFFHLYHHEAVGFEHGITVYFLDYEFSDTVMNGVHMEF